MKKKLIKKNKSIIFLYDGESVGFAIIFGFLASLFVLMLSTAITVGIEHNNEINKAGYYCEYCKCGIVSSQGRRDLFDYEGTLCYFQHTPCPKSKTKKHHFVWMNKQPVFIKNNNNDNKSHIKNLSDFE